MSVEPNSEFKIVFTGPMGAGKTTAIAAVSDSVPVSTEVENNDSLGYAKASTTVGLDFGRMTIADGHSVRLYGTPGQERFRFMWDIVGRGAAGVIVLLDATDPDVLAQMSHYVNAFMPLVPAGAIVIGLGRTGLPGATDSETLHAQLESQGLRMPVFSIDARQPRDVLLLLRALVSVLDAQPRAVAVA
jgi:signal recognition particle receptor subunit beta